MVLPLVNQLYFARSEFERCLAGVPAEDATKRILPMNCLSWILGHLAHHENVLWNSLAQGIVLHPEMDELVAYGQPASTPAWEEMRAAWRDITYSADAYLQSLTGPRLLEFLNYQGQPLRENIGTTLHRNIYHYWFHLGEAHAIRQALGHQGLPDFVGSMEGFFYTPETTPVASGR